jgi:hypothetical protein
LKPFSRQIDAVFCRSVPSEQPLMRSPAILSWAARKMNAVETVLSADRRCLLSLCFFGTTANAITSYFVMGSPKDERG